MKNASIRHANMTKLIAAACGFLFGLSFLLASVPAVAQDEGEAIEQSFKKLSVEEVAKLRAILAAPTNRNASASNLNQQLQDKQQAAKTLGEWPLIFAVYKEAVEIFPTAHHKSNLARRLMAHDDIELGNQYAQQAIDTAESPRSKAFYMALVARDYYRQGRNAEATKQIASTLQQLQKISGTTTLTMIGVARIKAVLAGIQSNQAEDKGQFQKAIDYADQAMRESQKAVGFLNNSVAKIGWVNTYETLAFSMRRKFYALVTARRFSEAQEVLRNGLSYSDLPMSVLADTYLSAASLRFAQRDFVQAERFQNLARDAYAKLKYDADGTHILFRSRDITAALIGQHRYPEALAEFQKLDTLAGDDKLKARVRYAFDRAVVYLYNSKAPEAASLLASEAQALAKQYGSGPSNRQHFFTAQASGLQGVALWRVGTPDSKAAAYSLLQAAVRDIMAPENVDYLENIGIRKELREMIFSTYIEAAAQTNPIDALAALGIADWLRGGLVQEALGDAAVRAAASNDALSNLVRQDQDARNEIKGLRNFLSGEAGGAASPLPEIAAKMRERIALLEKSRAGVQIKIKAAFPDYEKLVRPLPPSTAEIQAKLKPDEALIVLQPTDDAVFVWALNQKGVGAFHRANLPAADLAKLVKRMRASLDVAGQSANRMPAFDHTASQELYQKLLAPVQSGLQGKTSLIMAAGGALGQIPFGVLQTDAKDSWLIQQAAITHVPSVAAWLSMRSLPHKTAEQPMLAWGDPLFNLGNVATAGKSTGTEVRKVNLTRASTAVDLEKEDPHSALKYADIPALPETRDELLAIAKTLGADVAKDLILGSAATRESVLAANKNGSLAKRRVVAFATHGLMAGDLPNLTQPALAMAGTKDDATNVLAPLLTLEDVLGLKLNADWVVLSACNTAAADGKAEEALSGLARGFFYAGSRSLLVTHWAVDSDSAVTLTTETFKHYQNNPAAPKAESLRHAMLKVMSDPKTAHPAHWAPYALVGDGAR